MPADGAAEIRIGHYLAELAAGEVGNQVGRVGGKDHLILAGEPVEDSAGALLERRMKKQLRVFDHDNAGNMFLALDVGFQQGQHVNAFHAIA